MPDSADTAEATDRANDTADGDGMPDSADTAEATDANVFEIISRTSRFQDSITPNPEEIPSTESESPPDDPPIPLEPSGPETPQLVIEHFPHGNPGMPINGGQGSSIYESSQEVFSESVWAPFQSECDWDVAHWAKMNGPSSSALTDLLAIPNVRPPSLFFICVAKCGLSS